MQYAFGDYTVGTEVTYDSQQLWFVTDGTTRRYFTAADDADVATLAAIGAALLGRLTDNGAAILGQ